MGARCCPIALPALALCPRRELRTKIRTPRAPCIRGGDVNSPAQGLSGPCSRGRLLPPTLPRVCGVCVWPRVHSSTALRQQLLPCPSVGSGMFPPAWVKAGPRSPRQRPRGVARTAVVAAGSAGGERGGYVPTAVGFQRCLLCCVGALRQPRGAGGAVFHGAGVLHPVSISPGCEAGVDALPLGRQRAQSLTLVNDLPSGTFRCHRRRYANSSPGLRARGAGGRQGQRGGTAEEQGAPFREGMGSTSRVRGPRVKRCPYRMGGMTAPFGGSPGCPGSVPAVLPEAGPGPAGGQGGAVPRGPVKAAAGGGGWRRWRWAARDCGAQRRPGARGRATRGPCGGTASTGGLRTAEGLAGNGGSRTWGCGTRAWGRTVGESTWGGEQDLKKGPRSSGTGEILVSRRGTGPLCHVDMPGWGQVQTGAYYPPYLCCTSSTSPSSSSSISSSPAYFSAPVTCCGGPGLGCAHNPPRALTSDWDRETRLHLFLCATPSPKPLLTP